MMISFLSKIKCNNIKTTELFLEIIKEMVNKGIKYFKSDKRMIEIIKEMFKDFIMKNALSPNLKIFQLSFDLFNIVYINYRAYLKPQIESFFMNIIIGFLESEKKISIFKEIILYNIYFLLDKLGPNFLIEIYVNYDLDSNFIDIFCVLVNLFTKIKNGLYLQNKYLYTFKGIENINAIGDKILQFFDKFVSSLNDFLKKNKMNSFIVNNKVNDMNETYNEIVDYLKKKGNISSEEAFNMIKNEYISDYNNNTIKGDYTNIVSQGKNDIIISNNLISLITTTKIENLPQLNYIDYISYEISHFITSDKESFSNLDIKSLLYDNNTGMKILYYFIKIISSKFKNKNILESLRILFSFLPFTEEEKIINKIILTFGEIYHDINPSTEFQNINMIYYISFSLFSLNINLHKENTQKLSQEKFIENITQYYNINTTKGKYIYDTYSNYYDQIMKEPIIFFDYKFPKEKRKEKEQKEEIYNININNNDIRKFLEFSWNNFLYIYNQSINESIKKRNRQIFFNCIDNILILAKIYGILNLEKAQEAYLTNVLNMINLNEKEELNETMLEIIIKVMNYINENCQYIKTKWNKILEIISVLEYYLLEPEENIILNLRNSQKIKFTEKEIKIFLNKRNNLSLNISDAVCESIFCKTELFENATIIDFHQNLCIISKLELDSFYIPRLFSLNKLVELTHFNLFRLPYYWQKIWRIISNYLGEVIINYTKENIWKHALDSLKQIIIKLLQKEQSLNLNYRFQEEIFVIFEKILTNVRRINIKEESIIDILYFIVAKYGKDIKCGWKNIFDVIKIAFEIRNLKINDNIINILKYVYENNNIIFFNNDIEIFEKFIQILCLIYNEKTMKQFAFEIINGLLTKIIKEENSLLKMPNSNKIFDFIKIYFYNIDILMKVNTIEYLNLLFEIMNHNKNIILSKNLNLFLYIYFIFFKPNISLLLLSKYEKRDFFINFLSQEKSSNYSYLISDNEITIIKGYLERDINALINNFNSEEGKEYEEIFYEKSKENKNQLCGFLKEIKDGVNLDNNNIFGNYVKNKINEVKNIDENNYELFIKYFLEKFKNMIINQNQKNDQLYINLNYFYFDLLLTIQELSIFNNFSDLTYKILFKIISSSFEDISESNKNKLINNNNSILKIISSSIMDFSNEKDLFIFIKYSLDFSNYFLDFIQIFQFDFIPSFEFVIKLFNNILLFDLEEKKGIEKYKIINSSSTIVLLMKLQDIQLFIIKKFNKEKLLTIKIKEKSNTIIYLNKIFNKYLLDKEENSLMNKIIIFELDNILPKFVEFFNNEELNNIYECLINLICSVNHNIRNGVKNILKFLADAKIMILKNKEK